MNLGEGLEQRVREGPELSGTFREHQLRLLLRNKIRIFFLEKKVSHQ